MSASIHPYDPPQAALASPPRGLAHPWTRHAATRAVALMGASGALGFGMMGVAEGDYRLPMKLITLGLGVATALAVAGAFSGVQGIIAFARSASQVKVLGVMGSLFAVAANGVLSFAMFTMTMWSTSDFRRGRQLRSFGRILLPTVTTGDAWSRLDVDALPEEARVTAPQWRENGRTEHASVAAFAALTIDLMSLGAPPSLVAAANRDALDEIHHTELCFSLARALDGEAASPGPFPEAHRPRQISLGRTFGLARLAADSLVDGALHEGVSARVIAKLTRRCEVPAVRAMLKEIARDEGRHAAHGWDVVEWCVSEGGEPVVDALFAALRALPETMLSPLPPLAHDGSWERFGIHGHALEEAEYVAALAELRRRVASLAARVSGGAEILPEAC